MTVDPKTGYLDVKICDREYRVACTPETRDDLLAAVAYVDEKMRDIGGKSKAASPERVAVMAALNIANEFLASRTNVPANNSALDAINESVSSEPAFDSEDAKRRIGAMDARLAALLEGAERGGQSDLFAQPAA